MVKFKLLLKYKLQLRIKKANNNDSDTEYKSDFDKSEDNIENFITFIN